MAHFEPSGRTLNVFILAALSVAAVISLRNLPLSASFGISSIFFYGLAVITFMIPYALISAELASGWPKEGGVYIWVTEALGSRAGFFAIWMQWFHNVTWYPAMLSFIGATIAYFFDPKLAENKFYLFLVIVVGFWAITFLNFRGVKTSASFSTACVILGSIIPAIILIAFGFSWLLSEKPTYLDFSFSKIIPGEFRISEFVFLAGLFLALAGLESSANLAREVKNPQRSYPRAIFLAAGIVATLLILGSLSIAIVIPKSEISFVASLLESFRLFFEAFHLEIFAPFIFLLTLLGGLGELNAWVIATAKGLYATTKDGILPRFFHKVNEHEIPTRLLFVQAIIVTLASILFLALPNINTSYWVLSALSSQMYLLMYLLLFLSGIILKIKRPDVIRTFQVPGKRMGMWITSLLGIAASLFALFFSFFPPTTFEIGNILTYELILLVSIALAIAIPLIIYKLRNTRF